RPILSYIVAEGRAAGIEHFVFVTGRGKGAIEDYFDHQVELEAQLEAKGKREILDGMAAELPAAGQMSFVRQMAPLGLGHALWCARGTSAVASPSPPCCPTSSSTPSRPALPSSSPLTTRPGPTSSASSRCPRARRTSTASSRRARATAG